MESRKINVDAGKTLLSALVEDGAPITHECGGTLACATCCVIVREGMETLSPPSEDELDMLERASIEEAGARLACQAVAAGGEVVVAAAVKRIPARTGGSSPVSVTPRAAAHLQAQLAKRPGAIAVRLAVEPAGCSGFAYRIDPAETLREDDSVFDSSGVRLVVAPLSLPYVQGATVDLVQEGLAKRLRFDNPNARSSCGCGESFGV
jgi:iron-sulfur cluster assembly accessory protein